MWLRVMHGVPLDQPTDGRSEVYLNSQSKAFSQISAGTAAAHLLPPFVASFLLTLSIVLCKAFFTGPLPNSVML